MCWSLSQLSLGKKRGGLWIGRKSIAGGKLIIHTVNDTNIERYIVFSWPDSLFPDWFKGWWPHYSTGCHQQLFFLLLLNDKYTSIVVLLEWPYFNVLYFHCFCNVSICVVLPDWCIYAMNWLHFDSITLALTRSTWSVRSVHDMHIQTATWEQKKGIVWLQPHTM